jgi:predicted RNA-binding protein with RPS1 domain
MERHRTISEQNYGNFQVLCTHNTGQDAVVPFHGHRGRQTSPLKILSMDSSENYGMCHLSEFCRKFVAESKKYLSTGQERV